ncbi:MAG TPA: transporter [Candidatus Krumholzibacteria bacterium]|nr:transporter [Candidatus Krumholzibacteria bacterium]
MIRHAARDRPGRTAIGILAVLLCSAGTAHAQQLEPRAYAPAPIGLNFVGGGLLYSTGGVVTDPSLPIDNVQARVYAVPPYYGRTFGLIGRLASVSATVPYAWAHVTGDVQDVSRSVNRSGLADASFRFGVNLLGCPALTPRELAARKRGTTMGASISVSVPIGEYDGTKLINLGTNRWAYKPELGLTQPLLRDWILELYAGVWLYGTNDDFYGGNVRKQDPLATFQTHVVYSINPAAWVAANFTYYHGGSTTVGGLPQNDRQNNTRGGVTLSLPCGKTQSLRLTWAQGVSTRVGSSFQTFGVGWQFRWL